MEWKISVLPWETLPTYLMEQAPIDMVEKGLGRESDEVIVGIKAEGLKRFIVQIAIWKYYISQKSSEWEE